MSRADGPGHPSIELDDWNKPNLVLIEADGAPNRGRRGHDGQGCPGQPQPRPVSAGVLFELHAKENRFLRAVGVSGCSRGFSVQSGFLCAVRAAGWRRFCGAARGSGQRQGFLRRGQGFLRRGKGFWARQGFLGAQTVGFRQLSRRDYKSAPRKAPKQRNFPIVERRRSRGPTRSVRARCTAIVMHPRIPRDQVVDRQRLSTQRSRWRAPLTSASENAVGSNGPPSHSRYLSCSSSAGSASEASMYS